MRTYAGKVIELQSDYQGHSSAWIACPPGAVPAPGQYLKVHAPAITGEVLPATLFAAEIPAQGFRAASPIPAEWLPGTELRLWGPLGKGFRLGWTVRRLALAALEDPSRLMPLIAQSLERGIDVTLCADGPLPPLPASVEVAPLNALPEVLTWADFLAMDVPLLKLPGLGALLGLRPEGYLPCPAQVLIHTAMPCAGMAECGVCAVPTRRGWKLACQDGPVFDLSILEW
jgi:dihydroorotate dehydrogenase electron transfer subunit